MKRATCNAHAGVRCWRALGRTYKLALASAGVPADPDARKAAMRAKMQAILDESSDASLSAPRPGTPWWLSGARPPSARSSRPGTASQRPGTASQRPGTASRPAGAAALGMVPKGVKDPMMHMPPGKARTGAGGRLLTAEEFR